MGQADHALSAVRVSYPNHAAVGALYEVAPVVQVVNNLAYKVSFFQRRESY